MSIDFTKAEELPTGAEKFFKTFSRFEFALKECHFLLGGTTKAFADWPAFGTALTGAFFKEVHSSGRAHLLLTKPPKTQLTRDGTLDFEKAPPPKNTQQLLEAVCRVRNNLFHGGKHGDPDANSCDPFRNERLITEAQWILEFALEHNEDVRTRVRRALLIGVFP